MAAAAAEVVVWVEIAAGGTAVRAAIAAAAAMCIEVAHMKVAQALVYIEAAKVAKAYMVYIEVTRVVDLRDSEQPTPLHSWAA